MSTTDATPRPAATRWKLDPAQSRAEFRVPHFWGLVTVKGHFDRLDGWIETDGNGQRRLELVIDATSLSTGNHQRDAHLRSADFFDTDRHPQVRFRSTRISEPVDGRVHVDGELEAAGHQVTLTLQPTLQQTDERLQVEASTTVDQRRLGMTWSPLRMARTPATLIVHAELRPEVAGYNPSH